MTGPKMFSTVTVLSACAALVSGGAHAQADKAGMGSLEGQVVCAEGNTPARFATVRLMPLKDLGNPDGSYVEAKTDLEGRYSFAAIRAGEYIARALLAGYSDDSELILTFVDQMGLEERKAAVGMLTQVQVKTGGLSHLDLTIRRGGAISGQVSFDTGGALNHAEVKATLVSSKFLDRVSPAATQVFHGSILERIEHADDRGVYRFSALPEGKYRIEVRVYVPFDPNASNSLRRSAAELKVYSPDSLSQRDTKLVDVDYGDEFTGVDITIPISHLHSVGGVVTQGGAPLGGATVEIHPQSEKVNPRDWHWYAVTLEDGSYCLDLVPAGTYQIVARHTGRSVDPRARATRSITVTVLDADIADANVDLPRQAQ